VIFFSLTADTNTQNLAAAGNVTSAGLVVPGAMAPYYFAAPNDCIYSNATAAQEAYNAGDPDAG
jgi:hypothetical protein